MKITQTTNSLEIKTNGIGQAISGTALLIIGVALAVVLGISASAWTALFGLIFAGIGIVVLCTAQNRQVVIQKSGTSSITAKRLLGGSPQTQTFQTNDVTGVRLETYASNTGANDSGNSQSNDRRSTLSLIMKNNDIVQIADETGSAGGFSFNGMNLSNLIGKAPLGNEAKQISDYLGVELQAVDNTNMVTAVKSLVNAFQHPDQATNPTTVATTVPPVTSTAPVQPPVYGQVVLPTAVNQPVPPDKIIQ